jgi:D-glycero-D-manno-heptose 1,7-bisphosphate phosphatase
VTRAAAFLDRDGTINESPPEGEWVTRIEDFRLLPGAVDGMTRLARCGHLLVVTSNQRGVAKGLVSQELLRAAEQAVQEALRPHGVEMAGFYYCPHELEQDCDCRKPRPGMLLQAATELDLDLDRSWMVGDSRKDVEAGMTAGCRTAYLGDEPVTGATLSVDSLEAAAISICGDPAP